MSDWIPTAVAAISGVAAIIAAFITGNSAKDAQARQAETARVVAKGVEENNAGKLALEIAQETRKEQRDLRGRLEVTETWRQDMIGPGGWVPRHEVRDRVVERELEKLDPTFAPPPWEPLPPLRRYVPDRENLET